jgi:RNA 2',3'-cyclic 3'-phosphodiesterase
MTTAADSKRLFFAIWPSAKVRERLQQARTVFCPQDGRWTRPENLHMTLVFLGNIAVDQIPLIEAAAAKIGTSPFRMRLNWIRTAPAKGMVWLAPGVVPQGLMDLESALKSSLEAVDFEVEKRAYRPHVTLIRKLSARFEPRAIEAVDWPVDSFALVESNPSRSGSDYIRRRIWRLGD